MPTSEIEVLPSCPLCSGELVEKDVQKLLRGDLHTAVLRVKAEVCLQCGERLYSEATVRRFEEIRQKLKISRRKNLSRWVDRSRSVDRALVYLLCLCCLYGMYITVAVVLSVLKLRY